MTARWIAVIVATLVAIGTALAIAIGAPLPSDDEPHYVRGALDRDCRHTGTNADGSTQFIISCPQSVRSPDGRWIFELTTPLGDEEAYQVLIRDRAGDIVAEVPGLMDAMPFVLLWSPRPNWFLINHYRGSGLEQPRIFEIRGRTVVEHRQFLVEGQKAAIRLNPCLGDGSLEANRGRQRVPFWATGTALRWSRDGRRIIWVFVTRTDACMERDETGPVRPDDQWRPFYMISDVESGAIDPASIRMIGDSSRAMPTDGPYADF